MGISVPMDIGSHINATKGGVAARQDTSTTTTNGTGFDRTGYESAVLALNLGAITGSPSTGTVAVKLQDSADNSAFADFVPNTGSASIAAKAAAGFYSTNVNLLGARQYVRAVSTCTITGGTSPTITHSSTVIVGGVVSEPA